MKRAAALCLALFLTLAGAAALAMEAPQDAVNTLTGKLGRLPGVSAKTMYSGKIYAE